MRVSQYTVARGRPSRIFRFRQGNPHQFGIQTVQERIVGQSSSTDLDGIKQSASHYMTRDGDDCDN
jgi:hypothetical protein